MKGFIDGALWVGGYLTAHRLMANRKVSFCGNGRGQEGPCQQCFGRDLSFRYASTADGRFDQLNVCVIVQWQRRDKPELQGLPGDMYRVHQHFHNGGSRFHMLSCRYPPEPGQRLKDDILNFLHAKGNNKFLYFSGHASKMVDNARGALYLGNSDSYFNRNPVRLTITEVLRELGKSGFTGMMSIVLDSCYSSGWGVELLHLINQRDPVIVKLEEVAKSRKKNFYLNIRMSSLPSELSFDSVDGGRFTKAWLTHMDKEEEQAKTSSKPCSGHGWGTQLWTSRVPSDRDAVFSVSMSEPQSDGIVEVVFNTADEKWHTYMPESRRPYFQLDGADALSKI